MTIVKLLCIVSVTIAVMADHTVNQVVLAGIVAVVIGFTSIQLFRAFNKTAHSRKRF
jgi:hypothetical protein